jgi:predicted HTH transcriptional regulator
MPKYDIDYLTGLVKELCKLPYETEWVEFKSNCENADEIGEYISALANSAALIGKVNAYMIWGIDDDTHDIIGTRFCPTNIKIGNEPLENWLFHLIQPNINFRFHKFLIAEKQVVMLEIGAAFKQPVSFKQQEFIRVGSVKKKLKDFPEKERSLWRHFETIPFERGIAAENVSGAEIFKLLDHQAYFDI